MPDFRIVEQYRIKVGGHKLELLVRVEVVFFSLIALRALFALLRVLVT